MDAPGRQVHRIAPRAVPRATGHLLSRLAAKRRSLRRSEDKRPFERLGSSMIGSVFDRLLKHATTLPEEGAERIGAQDLPRRSEQVRSAPLSRRPHERERREDSRHHRHLVSGRRGGPGVAAMKPARMMTRVSPAIEGSAALQRRAELKGTRLNSSTEARCAASAGVSAAAVADSTSPASKFTSTGTVISPSYTGTLFEAFHNGTDARPDFPLRRVVAVGKRGRPSVSAPARWPRSDSWPSVLSISIYKHIVVA